MLVMYVAFMYALSLRYDTIQHTYVRTYGDEMASLI